MVIYKKTQKHLTASSIISRFILTQLQYIFYKSQVSCPQSSDTDDNSPKSNQTPGDTEEGLESLVTVNILSPPKHGQFLLYDSVK